MAKLTAAELKDLEAAGYVEGSANFPDNISPVLRAKALEAWKAKQDGPVTSADLPTAVDRQNQRVREQAAVDGDKGMQEYTGIKPEAFGGKGDHDGNGVAGGAKKPSDAKKV